MAAQTAQPSPRRVFVTDAEQLHAAEKQEGKAAPSSAVAKSSNCCNYPYESHGFILKVGICSPDALLVACAHTKPFFPGLSPCRFGAVLYRTAESPLACHLAVIHRAVFVTVPV